MLDKSSCEFLTFKTCYQALKTCYEFLKTCYQIEPVFFASSRPESVRSETESFESSRPVTNPGRVFGTRAEGGAGAVPRSGCHSHTRPPLRRAELRVEVTMGAEHSCMLYFVSGDLQHRKQPCLHTIKSKRKLVYN